MTTPPAIAAVLAMEQAARARARHQRWHDDPVAFAVEALGLTVWGRMRDLLYAVRDHDRVAVRSGHKVGKSFALAALALWWFWRGGQVLATGPTATVVDEVFWAAVMRLYQEARRRGVRFPSPGSKARTGMRAPDGRRLFGFSTDKPERVAIGGSGWLFVVDEASGVDEDIFTALRGQAAGGARILVVGNPTQPAGFFADAFGSATSLWHTLHISSLESPNITGEASIPGLATPEYVAECRDAWGEDSPLYHVRVLGNFAQANESAVIPLHLVLAAVQRWDAGVVEKARTDAAFAEALGELQSGVDVARFGDDDSVAVVRRGNVVLELTSRNGFDEPAVAGMTVDQVRRWRHATGPAGRPVRVKVDTCGVGAGVASVLRSTNADTVEVIGIDAAERANSDDFPNRRSELWFALQQWLRDGGAIPDDKRLIGDLVAPRYGFDARGRRVVEKKEDFKRRLKRSPDRADALALAVYRLGVRAAVPFADARDEGERRLLLERARKRAENAGAFSDEGNWRTYD